MIQEVARRVYVLDNKVPCCTHLQHVLSRSCNANRSQKHTEAHRDGFHDTSAAYASVLQIPEAENYYTSPWKANMKPAYWHQEQEDVLVQMESEEPVP